MATAAWSKVHKLSGQKSTRMTNESNMISFCVFGVPLSAYTVCVTCMYIFFSRLSLSVWRTFFHQPLPPPVQPQPQSNQTASRIQSRTNVKLAEKSTRIAALHLQGLHCILRWHEWSVEVYLQIPFSGCSLLPGDLQTWVNVSRAVPRPVG